MKELQKFIEAIIILIAGIFFLTSTPKDVGAIPTLFAILMIFVASILISYTILKNLFKESF